MKFINHYIKSAMQSILTSNLYKIHYKWMLFYYPFDTRNNLLHHLYIHLLTSVYTVNIYNDSYPITKTFSWEAVCHTHCQDLYPWEIYIQDMGILSPPKLSVRYLHCRDIFQWEALSFLWQTYSYTVGIYSHMESFLWHTYTNRHIPMGSCL